MGWDLTGRVFGAKLEHVLGAETMVQGSLLGLAEPDVDGSFTGLTRRQLDTRSWLDVVPDWMQGDQVVFDLLETQLHWRQRTVTMYERRLPEPRLTSWWVPRDGPEPLPVLAEARRLLSARYGADFDSIGCNLYRHGADSVAWHGDRHRHTVANPVVAIVSVGAARPFRLRPRGGGPSQLFALGNGDLFVMGGACQHDWEHTVPKVRVAAPRISITFRHGARRSRRGSSDHLPPSR